MKDVLLLRNSCQLKDLNSLYLQAALFPSASTFFCVLEFSTQDCYPRFLHPTSIFKHMVGQSLGVILGKSPTFDASVVLNVVNHLVVFKYGVLHNS